jgi:RNA polymerase sigma factor (sigma-70 family)
LGSSTGWKKIREIFSSFRNILLFSAKDFEGSFVYMNDFKNNPKEIWARLHAHEAEVFGYIKQAVGSVDIARDLYQDVYLQAWQHLPLLDSDRSLKNWLITVARNRVINYFREKKRRIYITLDEFDQPADSPAESPMTEAITFALRQLPPKQKEAFVYREMDGLNYQELSARLNLSVSASTSLLERARRNFTKHLILFLLPDWFRKHAQQLDLEDLARFVDSFESVETLLQRIQRKSQAYFDGMAKSWDELRQGFIDNQQFNRIIERLGDQRDLMTLDLGSGSGYISVHGALNGSRIVSVDLNNAMLAIQRQLKQNLSLSNLSLIQADITRLPLKKAVFDQIFLTLVLHHISDPLALIKDLAKGLKANGKLILIDFMKHRQRDFADHMHDLWLGFDPARIKRWAKSAGLHEVHFSTWDSQYPVKPFAQIFSKEQS